MREISIWMILLAGACHLNVTGQSGKNIKSSLNLRSYKVKYGIKAGYSYSQLTSSKTAFYSSARDGFMFGGFIEPPSNTTGPGFRSELIFSRQGFAVMESGARNKVTQDYIYMPVLATYNLGKLIQIQAGLQAGYLLNAKKETNAKNADENILGFYNRFDYGFLGGIELNPISGFILGGRYTGSLGKAFKNEQPTIQPVPLPFNPSGAKSRNSVMQIFIGFKF